MPKRNLPNLFAQSSITKFGKVFPGEWLPLYSILIAADQVQTPRLSNNLKDNNYADLLVLLLESSRLNVEVHNTEVRIATCCT